MRQATYSGSTLRSRDVTSSLRFTFSIKDAIVDNASFADSFEQFSKLIKTKPAVTARFAQASLPFSYSIGGVHPDKSSQRLPADEAAAIIGEYLRWYKHFVDNFERDLKQAGLSKPRRIEYGREQGLKKLAGLVGLIDAGNQAQVDTLRNVLEGFRELAQFTPDLEGRSVLVVALVEDTVSRLHELGLIHESTRAGGSLGPVSATVGTMAA